MARPSSSMIYYGKVFENMKRCLREAEEEMHPSARRTITLKNPKKKDLSEKVMDVPDAIEWCIARHLPSWSQGTWRMIRCGYRQLLNRLSEAGRVDKEIASKLIQKMEASKGLTKKEREKKKKTSSRRKKVVTLEHVRMIEEHVTERNSVWGVPLVLWLKAAMATGLRPNEWQTARLKEKDGRVVLWSENFKFNESRSYSDHREIDLTGLPEEWVESVKEHLRFIEGVNAPSSKISYAQYYQGCTSLLYECNKRLWPRRKANINLYTGRHQFSANAKANTVVSDVERAAMMGHKTTKTSTERYGRKSSGSNGLTPEIANKSVLSQIREVPATRSPHIQIGPGNKNE